MLLALVAGVGVLTQANSEKSLPFSVVSADGTVVTGQLDLPRKPPIATVIMVHGTGFFDRDVAFGTSNGPNDKIFLSISRVLTERQIAVVRYDRRGVQYGNLQTPVNYAVSSSSTVDTLRDDLSAVYRWAIKHKQLKKQCYVFFGHSEGMAHIGRLAETDVPSPAFVVGMGALLEAPSSVMKWQVSGRDAYSLSVMDKDGDGVTSNDEVQKNFPNTPSSIFGLIAPFLHPKGSWDKDAIDAVASAQLGVYDKIRTEALALKDNAPYPDHATPMARASWWKSWFLDETAVAARLAVWKVPVVVHYGEIDSQTPSFRQIAAAKDYLPHVSVKAHPALGHSLGKHPLFGPIEKTALDALVSDILLGVQTNCRR